MKRVKNLEELRTEWRFLSLKKRVVTVTYEMETILMPLYKTGLKATSILKHKSSPIVKCSYPLYPKCQGHFEINGKTYKGGEDSDDIDNQIKGYCRDPRDLTLWVEK